MATMISFATDWTFDRFMADCQTFKGLPIRGVHCRKGASAEEVFVANIKLICREWLEKNSERYYNTADALWYYLLNEVYFSDWYKDTYNQRPHLDGDLYLWALGFGDLVNTLTWRGLGSRSMDDIIGDYCRSAKAVREAWE